MVAAAAVLLWGIYAKATVDDTWFFFFCHVCVLIQGRKLGQFD